MHDIQPSGLMAFRAVCAGDINLTSMMHPAGNESKFDLQ